MTDPRYEYPRVNAIKGIIQAASKKILLLQEPETNAWMPLHWGMPGGKPLKNESLLGAFQRKMREETGLDIKPEGIFRIEELIQGDKTIFIYILYAKVQDEFVPQGEAKTYRWVSPEEIRSMPLTKWTEFFNKDVLENVLSGEHTLIPLSTIETRDYNQLREDKAYQDWFNSGQAEKK
jgi:ADP-ribose pyrophosphatase YjhB (NUDIX family)